MADIVRGISFQPTETATASKLHRLVDNATIAGLTADDFVGSFGLVGTATPATATEGAVWQGLEVTQFEESTYSGIFQFSAYFVKTSGEEVKLFDPYGFETRRYLNSSGDIGTANPGVPCETEGPGGGETLVAYGATTALNEAGHAVFGSVVNTTFSGFAGRVLMRGFGMAVMEGERAIGTGWPHVFIKTERTTSFALTNATNANGALGQRLSDYRPLSGFRRVPVLMYGGPVWRAER